jgi:hypothetical protein
MVSVFFNTRRERVIDDVGMTIDLPGAVSFSATHARLLDRHRLDLLLNPGAVDPAPALAALEAYRNPDGGYGWGLEPDLRATGSQPGAALHAFELWADVGTAIGARAEQLCDWLDSISLADGGLPFALPIGDPAGCAPFWVEADPHVSSLQITSVVAANAHRLAAHDAGVAAHPWLRRATNYCLDAIRTLTAAPPAYVLTFSLRFLDAVVATEPEAPALIDRLVTYLPASGLVPVAGGIDGETLRPLDYAPEPASAVRARVPAEAVDADLRRLADRQQADGGWPVEWGVSSPAAALEWRGYLTVGALMNLIRNQVLEV